ncbi:alpha/beta hydrolase [Jiella mangrovi]|uniref:Palmitoyl-protein thioesterase ABHD10, mitochondrial n=1 Tax=Jiella mangrovi TaxID=2821407 RepID=A0ABS4BC36_9HYPH|nr:alpha/beta fold hydrolase [Jiella mangrovi]
MAGHNGGNLVGPRLPGHGTSPDDMETTGYLDWLGEAEAALTALAARKRKVFVTGLSMGGTLTLNLGARFGDRVAGIAPIAAAAGQLTEAFAEVMMLNPRPKRLPGIGSDIKAPGVEELAYQEVPVKCMADAVALFAATSDLMGRITCPCLVIHGREDHIVPASNALKIVNAIASDDIRLLWLNESYHVATLDNDKDVIVDRVGSFFSELAAR